MEGAFIEFLGVPLWQWLATPFVLAAGYVFAFYHPERD